MSALLIVDTQVRNYDTIVAAAKPTTTVVTFDSKNNTLTDIVNQVKQLSEQVFETVGLVKDGTDIMSEYRIVEKQQGCDVTKHDFASWAPVIEFLKDLQATTGMKNFDFVSCLLYSNTGFAYAMDAMCKTLGVTLRASKDHTGNKENGGNWIQESANVDIRDVYFTDAIDEFKGLLYSFVNYGTNTRNMVTPANPAYAMVGHVGTVDVSNVDVDGIRAALGTTTVPLGGPIQSWGLSGESVNSPSGENFVLITAATSSFSALDASGKAYYWGVTSNQPPSSIHFTTIAASQTAFAGLDVSGHIYTWGSLSASKTDKAYIAIAAANGAFAALDVSGNVYAWGDSNYGGWGDISGTSNVISLAATATTFATLDASGNIYSWGQFRDDSYIANYTPKTISGNFKSITPNNFAFAAIDVSGNITCWGYPRAGGNLANNNLRVITGSFKCIASNADSFAALDISGNVTAWGSPTKGGNIATTNGTDYRIDISGKHYSAIVPNLLAYTAIDEDSHLISWGDISGGGNVSAGTYRYTTNASFTSVAASVYGFGTIDTSGNLRSWGYLWNANDFAHPPAGAFPTPSPTTDKFKYLIGGANVFAGIQATAAGNKIYSWGAAANLAGAPTTAGYNAIVTSTNAFAAIKSPIKTLNINSAVQYNSGSNLNIFSDFTQFAGDTITVGYTFGGQYYEYTQTGVGTFTGNTPTSTGAYTNVVIISSSTGRYTYITSPTAFNIVAQVNVLSINPRLQWIGEGAGVNIFFNLANAYTDVLNIIWSYAPYDPETSTIHQYTQASNQYQSGEIPTDPGDYVIVNISTTSILHSYQVSTPYFTILAIGLKCFLKDTEILTQSGYARVQDLRRGDLVKIADGRYLPISHIVSEDIIHPARTERIKDQLYVCRKDKYPELTKDLVLTGAHAILVDGFKEGEREQTLDILKKIYITGNKYRLPACVDGRTRVWEKAGPATIYHFALENPNPKFNYGVYANGLLVETCSIRYITEKANMTLVE